MTGAAEVGRLVLEGGVVGGVVWDPEVCVPAMAQGNLTSSAFPFFTTPWILGRVVEGGLQRGGASMPPPKKNSNSGCGGLVATLELPGTKTYNNNRQIRLPHDILVVQHRIPKKRRGTANLSPLRIQRPNFYKHS